MTATCMGCSTSCAQRQQPLEGQLGRSVALQSVDSCINQENAHAWNSPSSSEETRLRLTDYPAAPHPKAMPHLLIAVGDSLVPEPLELVLEGRRVDDGGVSSKRAQTG